MNRLCRCPCLSRVFLRVLAVFCLVLISCQRCSVVNSAAVSQKTPPLLVPPVADQRPHLTWFGRNGSEPMKGQPAPFARSDVYHWLRDDTRNRSDVMDYLKEENQYLESKLAELRITELQGKIFKEFFSSVSEEDSVSEIKTYENWFYYERNVAGKGYPIICRRPRHKEAEKDFQAYETSLKQAMNQLMRSRCEETTGAIGGPEEVLFDVNEMAKGHETYNFAGYVPSPDHEMVAYAVDTVGNDLFDVRTRSVASYRGLGDSRGVLRNVASPNMEWDIPGENLFYVVANERHRPYRVMIHSVGADQEQDILLYENKDSEFFLWITKTTAADYLVIVLSSSDTKVSLLLHLYMLNNEPRGSWAALLKEVTPREPMHRYVVEQHDVNLWMITNRGGAVESKISVVPLFQLGEYSFVWRDVFSYDPNFRVEDMIAFKNHIAVHGRYNARETLHIINPGLALRRMFREETLLKSPAARAVSFREPAYHITLPRAYIWDSEILRFTFESMRIPQQIVELDMRTLQIFTLAEDKIPNYDKEDYGIRRVFYPSHDNVYVPMTLFWKRSFCFNIFSCTDKEPLPVLLDGYGSYGLVSETTFDIFRLPMVRRGFVYAIAHVRGGSEMGRQWYDTAGRLLSKKNTFYDFIYGAEYLQGKGVTVPAKTAIFGASAGGLLVGACLNMRPDLFGAAVAKVPFVDLLNTMVDETLPLTEQEWGEWGNPNDRKYFYYMLEYSPYDNVRMQNYPHLFVTAGLRDSKVPYWEPVKWVAKLRQYSTSKDKLLLLKIEMTAGHSSATDRFDSIKEGALALAFVIYTIQGEKALPVTPVTPTM